VGNDPVNSVDPSGLDDYGVFKSDFEEICEGPCDMSRDSMPDGPAKVWMDVVFTTLAGGLASTVALPITAVCAPNPVACTVLGHELAQAANPIPGGGGSGALNASAELLENMVRHGRTIEFALEGTEELRYLDAMGAEANAGGVGTTHILLRQGASKVAALEEFLHGTQDRLGIIARVGVAEAELLMKNFLRRHKRLLGLMEE
jgi:hypothetical protein